MNNTSSSVKRLLVRLALVAALIPVLGYLARTDEPAQAPAPAVVQAPTAGLSDLEDEVWWTTTDCPAGVQVPCLDPTADPTLVPAEVAAQLHALVEAQWLCIDQVGQPMTDDTVRVTDAQLQQCRQYAYAAATPEAGGPAALCETDRECAALDRQV